jgi:hypothetical protein
MYRKSLEKGAMCTAKISRKTTFVYSANGALALPRIFPYFAGKRGILDE